MCKKDGIKYIFRTLQKCYPKLNLHPHLFRHSFATMILKKGAKITTVQKLMGHKSIESTMVYVHQSIDEIQEEIEGLKIKF